MISEHVDREDQIMRRPGLAVAPLDAFPNRNRDRSVIAIILVAGCNPGDDVVAPFGIGVVKVERLVGKVPARFGRASQQKWIKRSVVFELTATVLLVGAVGYKRAIARHGALLTTAAAAVEG